ncbi:MAG: crossover junction endodeoxyribonuclease RuvC [Fibrobacterota bacterium]|nr:crossover junction endodeoxyribonuclease RuvC [Fibrobacterota bacterium]
MIVLGVDPGTHRTGYAFLENRNSRIRVLEYGVIRCKSDAPLPLRLEQIHRELKALMLVYSPVHMALESIFFAKFPQSALILGHARGAIMVAAQTLGIGVSEYAPQMVKKATVGTGRATKERVASMIQVHLGLKEMPTPADAADALAIAFCHLIQANKRG